MVLLRYHNAAQGGAAMIRYSAVIVVQSIKPHVLQLRAFFKSQQCNLGFMLNFVDKHIDSTIIHTDIKAITNDLRSILWVQTPLVFISHISVMRSLK